MTCAPHTTEALGSINKPDGGKVSGLQREDPKFAEGKRASVWQRKNLLGRKEWCIPNAPSSENFPVVSIKKTDSCFQRWEEPGRGAGGSPGKGSIAQGIGCGSKKLWRPYPEWIWQGLGTDQNCGTTSIWPFCPLDPCPQCMLLVCLLSGDTTASGPGHPLQQVSSPWGRRYDEVAAHITTSQMGTGGKPLPFPFWFS